MTPTYWDNAIYTIRGDLIELRRHVTGLLDDVGFVAKHDSVRAIDAFDNEAYAAAQRLKHDNLDRFRAARHKVGLHPQAAILLCCVAGALIGWALMRALRSTPPNC